MKRILRIGIALYVLMLTIATASAFLKLGLFDVLSAGLEASDLRLKCMAAPLVGLPCALVPLVLWAIPKIGKGLWFAAALALATWGCFEIVGMAWAGRNPIISLTPSVLAWGLAAYVVETLWQLSYMLGKTGGGTLNRVVRPHGPVTNPPTPVAALVPMAA